MSVAFNNQRDAKDPINLNFNNERDTLTLSYRKNETDQIYSLEKKKKGKGDLDAVCLVQ